MLNDQDRDRAAELLLAAERSGEPATQLAQTFPGMEIADAYAVQKRVIDRKMAQGARLRGHKIGLTSKAMQSTVGIDEPDYGHLLDTMFFQDGQTISTAGLIVPRVEVELAFVLGKPLRGPDVTLFDVLDATDYVVPALEIIDGRSKYPRTIVDNIADNAACAGIVLGGRPVRPMDIDLRWVGAILLKNGVIEESGVSAAVLGHPGLGIAWLANKLAQHDAGLQAGHVVLAGSFTRTVAVRAGDTLHADYGKLGGISVHFS
ncbi:2-oxo-hept-4-ene-1,7-dioate hydratase [Bordetella bronchialis]|uniref:2-oxo-hepta-3-ene-1,7-dioic acid hydratase n=1 Tax=Bordetella bronchialis TaxID=463025 RepID=A0ABN4QWX5_9BORD|nr:2-oxo-hepta-3-ene-1,7-dioic acid hydratase [Bordetella bronchialis]ANN65512.1 2-oxo-hepta-3-ene-1,7-dioic acid hydratase [Bordetella bronchialis]